LTAVLADVSIKREFIRSANLCPSAVDTCLENSWSTVEWVEREEKREYGHLVDFVAYEDLYDGCGNVCF
jgi:hypothetical protein